MGNNGDFGGKPIILIGSPCFDKVVPEVLEDWMRFAYHCGRRLPKYDFMLGIKTKTEQFRARNVIVERALKFGATWILMLDDDMIINHYVTQMPTEDYGFLERLIAHNKDICGVLYYQRGGECRPVLMNRVGERGYRFLRIDEIEGRLQRVDVVGGGCMLIRASIFDKIKPPYFDPEREFGTDIQICRKAAAGGFEVWADTSIEFGHVAHENIIITSRNRLQYQTGDAIPGDIKKTFVMAEIYGKLRDDASEYTGLHMFDLAARTDLIVDFMEEKRTATCSDPDWYRKFPLERVCRQIWTHTENDHKRMLIEFVLMAIKHDRKLRILDFGCGIGLTAFTLAERGHFVEALDIRGTGTIEFLKWRSKKHNLPIIFHETDGELPRLAGDYDIIIAMDCLEHIRDWKSTLAELSKHLRPNGAMFSNNAILEDCEHPEHYVLDNKDFILTCMDNNLMPANQLTYIKKPVFAKEAQHA